MHPEISCGFETGIERTVIVVQKQSASISLGEYLIFNLRTHQMPSPFERE